MQIEYKANILVVDDNPAKRLALVSVLEQLNQNIVVAESGRDALRLLLSHEYAVILMDVQMPDMDGFVLLLAAGAIPLLILETVKVVRSARRKGNPPNLR